MNASFSSSSRPVLGLLWALAGPLGCEPGLWPPRPEEPPAGLGLATADRDQALRTAGLGTTPAPAVPSSLLVMPSLQPEIAGDVPTAAIARLRRLGDRRGMQALYDDFAWQNFVAINWPTDDRGRPRPHLGDAGAPAWVGWRESFEVFAEDGATPAAWGSARRLSPSPHLSAALRSLPIEAGWGRSERILSPPGRSPRRPHAEGLNQPFSLPLWDQRGNLVYYEVLINRSEFDYIVANQLYNLDGQVAFASRHPGRDLDPTSCSHPNREVVVMPAGRDGGSEVGAIEIKLAWRLLTDDDIASRYLTLDGWVAKDTRVEGSCATGDLRVVATSQAWRPARLGLVGFHIGHKTQSAPQWVWSTFEQVDNLAVEAREVEAAARHRRVLRPSFYDPGCPGCPVNVCAAPPQKNQLRRVLPIDPQTAARNTRMRHHLAALGSPLAYYELVGTQFPTQPAAPPTPPQAEPGCSGPTATPLHLPDSVYNKSGGWPQPVFLTNLTLESFFQRGVQPACLQVEPGVCPDPLPPSAPTIDATESCIGCHSSAPIASSGPPKPGTQEATYNTQLSGDYSWLLSQRAFWKK